MSKGSNIDLQTFLNTTDITQTKIISDYEGEKIPELTENLLICGDIIDSTVGGGGDSSKMPVNGHVGDISKNHNLYNIYRVLTDDKIRLILGNRDFNKIKCLPLCKMKYIMTVKKQTEQKDKKEKEKEKTDIENFNNGKLDLSLDTYKTYFELIKKNDWIANMNNWLPFWNDTTMEIGDKQGTNYKTWRDAYKVAASKTPFLDRFNKIFGVDGSVGTMSAGNLLYTIPFEVLGVDEVKQNIPEKSNQIVEISAPKDETPDIKTERETKNKKNRKNMDYLAFIVLSVFNAGFNKIDISAKSVKQYSTIATKDNLHATYINGLFYRFYKAIGTEKVNFMGYLTIDNKKLYLFSHGGITSDLIENPNITDLQAQIAKDYEKITNSEKKTTSQQGGAIEVTKEFEQEKIKQALNIYNDNVCKIVQKFMNEFYECMEGIKTNKSDLSEYTYMPSHDMLLLLSLGAPYKPVTTDKRDTKFVMRSPINPGIVEIINSKQGFVCTDAILTQIFGHVPKGFGPTFFTLEKGKNKSYLANIDMSQSFKYSGWAGKTNVTIGFNRNTNIFTLYYVLDFSNDTKISESDKKELTQIFNKDSEGKINNEDNGKYILINITEEPLDKNLIISQTLDNIFENEENLKTELKDKIKSNVILYHGFKSDDKLHIFSLSDSMTSFNKVLVLYKSTMPVPVQSGGYYEKYMKYKTKYIALKNSML